MKPSDSPIDPLVPAPAFLARWRYRILLAATLLVPFFVPIPRFLKYHPVISEFGDRLHVVLLGGTALFLYWYGPLRGRLLRTAAAAACIGGLIELLQTHVGRHALWHDFFQDLIGIGIAVGFLLWRGKGSRPGLVLLVVLVLLVPYQMRELPQNLAAIRMCREEFPLLSDFEDPLYWNLWSEDNDGEMFFDTGGDEHGRILCMETGPSDRWPGMIMRRFPPDWSEFRRLKVDLRVKESDRDTVSGGIVVSDFEGFENAAWKTWRFEVTRQWQTVTFSLEDLAMEGFGRDLDISNIYSLKIYLSRPSGHPILEIDNLRLE